MGTKGGGKEPLNGQGRAGAGGAGATRGRSSISDARTYSPRGRTVRDSSKGDPFRPALEVLQGGQRSSSRAKSAAAGRAAAAGKAAGKAAQPKQPTGRQATGRQTTAKQVTGKPAGPRKSARITPPRPTVQRTARASQARRSRGAGTRRTPVNAKPTAPPRPADPRRRLRLATVLALALFTLIAGRLVQLQLTDARAYAADGLADRLREVDLPAPRGTIYDRDGNILVHSIEARYVYADPTGIADPEATADKLFPLLDDVGVARSELLTKLTRHKRPDGTQVMFEYLARGIDIEIGNQIQALKLPGIGVRRDERREVPGVDLAANVLGFTGRGDDHAGLAGLEYGYDAVLRGKDGKRTFEVGVGDLNKEIPSGASVVVPARPGQSLRLTIDRDLQWEAQSALYERMKAEQALFACAIVMEVRTGAVLAQASYPSYNAAKPLDTPAKDRKDACTEIVFDPGSIHKSIVMAGALQEGVITPETTIPVGPKIKKGDVEYTDTHPQSTERPMTIPGILGLSSNIGTIKVADLLGKQKLYEYQQRFGLGKRTNCGLPAEVGGALLPPERWSGSSPGSIPIGAGVATTALQMAGVYSTIANDGVWVQPRLVQATVNPSGKATPTPAAQTRRVIDARHAQDLRLMLEAVTSPSVDGATGKAAAIPGYRIAGKTGTGELPQAGAYAAGKVVSFVGMAPADAPRYVVAVFAHTMHGGGGSVAAPVFKDLMTFTLGHFQVPPTGTAPPPFKVYP